jgi:hypothetical protein
MLFSAVDEINNSRITGLVEKDSAGQVSLAAGVLNSGAIAAAVIVSGSDQGAHKVSHCKWTTIFRTALAGRIA